MLRSEKNCRGRQLKQKPALTQLNSTNEIENVFFCLIIFHAHMNSHDFFVFGASITSGLMNVFVIYV